MDEEVRLTDAIPRKLTTYLLLLLGGIGIIACIELLYVWMPFLGAYTADRRIAAFDLTAETSLCVYFSSAALQLAGLVAILVYMIRRHRVDDYQGEYRIWLWAAMCWFLLSADEVAQFHQGFKALMVAATGIRLSGDGSLWWILPYFFLLGAVGLRLLVDMRECILSTTVGAVAAICCIGALFVHSQWLTGDLGSKKPMIEQGLKMGAEVLLLLAMLLHGRHVVLDAEGNLPAAKPKPVIRKPRKPVTIDFDEITDDQPAHGEKADSEPMAAETPDFRAVDPPHPIPAPTAAGLTLGRTVSSTASSSPQSQGEKKMTKAERKALRKRLEDMRHDREGR
jgi:hypothetical protein